MNRKPILITVLTAILLFTIVLGASAAGPVPAAWTATQNSKNVGVIAGESLTGFGNITADGNYICAGEDNTVTAAKLGSTDLKVFTGNPITGQSLTAAILVKADGAPFKATEAISVTVKNGSDTDGVGFNAYDCAGVTLPKAAADLIAAYVVPAPLPAPKPAALSTAGLTLTNWAQFDPTIYQDTKVSAITGNYTVTVAGDFAMFGVDDEATSLTLNGKEVLANCTANVKMQGELLRTIVCPGPFAVNDKLVVKVKDTKGGGSGIYAQSGVNRFAGTFMNWDKDAKTLIITNVMPDENAAQAEAAALATKPAADPRLDVLEVNFAELAKKYDALYEAVQLILARLAPTK